MLAALLSETTMLPFAAAAPAGPSVVAGEAQIAGLGTDRVTITQASQRAIINWQSFNIAPNEVAHFIQPNVRAIALNRIFDQNPSQIFGSLRANGTVILLNQNGIMFGPTAQVNVGGLIASSLNLSNANFLAGHYLFEGAGVEGAVKNTGALHGAYDGIYLLAPNVENSGLIVSPGGNVVLGAAQPVPVSAEGDLAAPGGVAIMGFATHERTPPRRAQVDLAQVLVVVRAQVLDGGPGADGHEARRAGELPPLGP